jgi:hypothetical protein
MRNTKLIWKSKEETIWESYVYTEDNIERTLKKHGMDRVELAEGCSEHDNYLSGLIKS